MKNFKLILITILLSTTFCRAQSDLENILSDLSFLMQEFVEPGIESTMYQTSSGWYTDAKALDTWEVKVSVQGNMLFIPNKKKTFFVDNNALSNLSVRPGDSPFFSTAAGGVSNSYLVGSINGNPIGEIYAPSGINQSYVTHGLLNLEVGLPYGTSITGRISPKTKIKSSSIQAFGFGLKHNISQWISELKASTFDLSLLAAYSLYQVNDQFSNLELLPGESINSIKSEGETFLLGLISSKKIGAFDVSLAVLHSNSKPDLSFGGQGTIVTSILNETVSRTTPRVLNTTVDLGLSYNYKDFSLNSILTIGDFTNLLVGLNYQFKLKTEKKDKTAVDEN